MPKTIHICTYVSNDGVYHRTPVLLNCLFVGDVTMLIMYEKV